MKAWKINSGDEWTTLIHADTAGKAKAIAMRAFDYDDYISFSARRFPEMDDKPFTYQATKDAGFDYWDDCGKSIEPEEFYNDCPCEICR
jgi:hypothetical protein